MTILRSLVVDRASAQRGVITDIAVQRQNRQASTRRAARWQRIEDTNRHHPRLSAG